MTSSPPPVPPPGFLPHVNLHSTLGAAFVGMVVSALLFGTSNLQVYTYFHQFPNDWIVYRASVAILWVLDALHLALVVHGIYYYTISNFGNYLELAVVVWSFKLQVVANVVMFVMVQSLYCLRLWKLNYRRTLLPRLVPLTVVAGAGIGTALIVKIYQVHLFSDLTSMRWASYASFGVVAFIDFAIAGTMCHYLRGSRSDFAATNSKISALILWTLSTGLITSVCSLMALIMCATMPGSLVFLAIEFLLTKLYFNSFIAMLNARTAIKIQGSSEGSYSTGVISHTRSPHLTTPRSPLPYFGEDKSIPLGNITDTHFSVVKVQNPHLNPSLFPGKMDPNTEFGDDRLVGREERGVVLSIGHPV